MASIKLIKNNPDQSPLYTYTLGNFKRFTYDINTPVTPAPLPEEDASQNVLVKIEGNSAVLKITWTIKNFDESQVAETEDENNDNEQLTVQTIAQHLAFFRNQFVPESIEDSFTLLIDFNDVEEGTTGYDSDNKLTYRGTFSKISFAAGSDSPVALVATIDFIEGIVIAIYDLDVPSDPLNVKLSVVNNDDIRIDWSPPITDNTIMVTGYKIRYQRTRVSPSDWFDAPGSPITDSSIRSFTITSLPDDRYKVQIAATSANGDGRFNTRVITIDAS